MGYWLMKSEPSEFGIDDLRKSNRKTAHWDGVRNYQARNMMRDEMKTGDQVFFYHSNCAEPAIVGIAKVVREGYPDHTAFDPDDPHYDPKSDAGAPRWFMVDVQYVRKLKRPITLAELKGLDDRLSDFALLRKGNRLSIMPVDARHWQLILELEDGA